jgi:uncharacterized protein involved in exopolysaccharide biosynthesis
MSAIGAVNVLLRYRRSILVWAVAAAIVALAAQLLGPRTYTATASFVPQSAAPASQRLAGLAAQFGVALSAGDAGRSPQFYADLLRARAILLDVVRGPYPIGDDETAGPAGTLGSESVSLARIFGIQEDDSAAAEILAMEQLRDAMAVDVTPETGVVTVSVEARSPGLAGRIVARMLELLGRFDVETRQSEARAERRFVEARLGDAQAELRSAEDKLQLFLQQNKNFENAPALRFEHDRLQRAVLLRQSVLTSLAQSYEQARVEEVRNTPVMTVIQRPDPPPLPDPRRLPLVLVVALAGGGLLGVVIAFGRDTMVQSQATEPDAHTEFLHLKRAALDDVTRLVRWRSRKAGHG